MIIPIFHKSYPLPLPFPQDLVTQVQLFQLSASQTNPPNISALTIPIIVVPPMDEPLLAIPTKNVLNFIAPTVSSVVIPEAFAPRPCPQTTTPSWTQLVTSPITRSTREIGVREIGVLEMELQYYKEGNVTDVWNSPSFSAILPFPLSHSLWDMITNNEGISLEIWDQFIGGDVLSITFWKAESTASSCFMSFHSGLIYIIISMITPYTASHHHAYTPMSAWLTHPSTL